MGRENHAQALASADHWVAAHALRESEKRPVYHFAPPYGGSLRSLSCSLR